MKKIIAICSNSFHRITFMELKKYMSQFKEIDINLVSFDELNSIEQCFELQDLNQLKKDSSFLSYIVKTFIYVNFKAVSVMTSKIDALAPDLILLGNDTGHYERALIRIAKQQNIKTILLQDGLIFNPCIEERPKIIHSWIIYFYQKFISRFVGGARYGYGGCDIFFVLGSYWKDMISNLPFKLFDSIDVVGSPYFESFISAHEDDLSNQNNATEKTFTISYFLTNFISGLNDYNAHQRQLTEVREIVCRLRKEYNAPFKFIVKVHPHDDISYYSDLFALGDNIEITQKKSLDEIFKVSDLCITNFSSVFIQGYFKNKVFFLSNIMLKDTKYSNYILSLSLPTLKNFNDFDRVIQQIKNSNQVEFIKEKNCCRMMDFIYFDVSIPANKRIAERIEQNYL